MDGRRGTVGKVEGRKAEERKGGERKGKEKEGREKEDAIPLLSDFLAASMAFYAVCQRPQLPCCSRGDDAIRRW